MGAADIQQKGNLDSPLFTCPPPITHSVLSMASFSGSPTDSITGPHYQPLPHLPVCAPPLPLSPRHLSGPSRKMDTLTPRGVYTAPLPHRRPAQPGRGAEGLRRRGRDPLPRCALEQFPKREPSCNDHQLRISYLSTEGCSFQKNLTAERIQTHSCPVLTLQRLPSGH